jgi:RNase H-like domain found in reverse transcriptase/Reverse transcriptase (RNA-dependent DNA polymerase)/dUTPase
LESGCIVKADSPQATPFFFIKKKDGWLRPVQDYRQLNDNTRKDSYPLPLATELLDRIKDSKYFTKLDIRWGYNNIWIREGDKWKAAFICQEGLFIPKVMFFRLCNSPATFQRMMNNIFANLITKEKVTVYLDDILIATLDLLTHIQTVRKVLDIIQTHNLYLKLEKCDWIQKEVDKWKIPQTKQELQSFLGFANYYWRFIEGYSDIVKPLTTLTGKVPWNWKEEEQEAFNELKCRFHNRSILSVIQRKGKLRVKVDASQWAMGGVLTQLQQGEWKTIAFWSQAFSEAERNYDTSNRELNTVISALKHWRQYLVGTEEPFKIWTDYQNLLFWSSPQNLTRRHARWVLTLADYNFTLHHIPGDKNKQANALSRMPQYEMGENDNDQTVILPPALFRNQGERKWEVLKVKRSTEKAKIPTKGSKDAAGYDLYSIKEKTISKESQELISIGIHISIPKGTYAE